MNGFDIIEAVNNIDEKLLTADAPHKKRVPRIKIFAVAAALILILGCVTVGGVSLMRGKFAPIETGTHGYTASFELEKFKWSDFKGDVAELQEIIREQYANYTPPPLWSNDYLPPGAVGVSFATYDEAVDYFGLDALKRLSLPFDEPIIATVVGDEEGKISQIYLFCQHILIAGDPSTGNYGGAFSVTIFTENCDISSPLAGGDFGDYDPGKIEHKEFITSKGVLCQYTEVGVGDHTRQNVQGFILDNGILYKLDVTFDGERLETAMEVLKNWAEQF